MRSYMQAFRDGFFGAFRDARTIIAWLGKGLLWPWQRSTPPNPEHEQEEGRG